MKTSISAMVRISGDFDPAELTRTLGVQPTSTWRRGDPRGRSPVLRYATDLWIWSPGYRESLDVGEEVTRVLDFLATTPGLSERLARMQLQRRLFVAIHVYNDAIPAMSFEAGQLERLSALGMALEVDLVLFGDD